ncbi:MAG: hypothetical protein ACFE85_01020 [Candidatus Hodarchaeota archaeon]
MPKIRICPKCKESKLKNALNTSGWLAPDLFECKACGYIGSFYLEVDPEDIENDLSKPNTEE